MSGLSTLYVLHKMLFLPMQGNTIKWENDTIEGFLPSPLTKAILSTVPELTERTLLCCGQQEVITIEPNGDVSPCDKYVGDTGSLYGSLMKNDLADLLANSTHNQIARREEQEAFNNMHQCRWFYLCQGGCPHDRVINRRHAVGYQDDCCGTGKLLAVITACLDKEKNTVLS